MYYIELEEELAEDISSLHQAAQDAKDASELSVRETSRKTSARLLDALAECCVEDSVSTVALPIIGT